MDEPTPTHPRIRTFHARHGRRTPSQERAVRDLLPRFALPDRLPDPPLVLEVGCGHGDAALAFAAAHPDHRVVAADVHLPGVAHLLEALEQPGSPGRVHVHLGDALELLDERADLAGLAGIHAFFPDPWPKARHRKRRLVRPDVVDLLVSRLAIGGVLRVATDVADYAEQATEVLAARADLRGGVVDRPAWRPGTGYEARAVAAGRSIVELAHERIR